MNDILEAVEGNPNLEEQLVTRLLYDVEDQMEVILDDPDTMHELAETLRESATSDEAKNLLAMLLGVPTAEDWFSQFSPEN